MRLLLFLTIIFLYAPKISGADQSAKIKVMSCISGLKSIAFEKIEQSLLCLHELQIQGEGSAGYAIYQYFFNGAPKSEQNPQLAISYLVDSAKLNHARSLDRLAWHLETGNNIGRDLKAAYAMYLKAAELGFSRALFNLGRWLISGEGVSQDIEAAFKLFHQASFEGESEAQFELAHMYEQGIATPRDFVKYRQYLLKAASGGHIGAALEIARNYLEGRYGNKDVNMAVNWLKTQEGNPRVDMMRCLLLLSQPDVEMNHEGYALLNSLSSKGHAPASKFLADLHSAGGSLLPRSAVVEEVYSRTAQRQAGQIGPINRNPSLGKSVPERFVDYSETRQAELWPEFNPLEIQAQETPEVSLSVNKSSLQNWLKNYRNKRANPNKAVNQPLVRSSTTYQKNQSTKASEIKTIKQSEKPVIKPSEIAQKPIVKSTEVSLKAESQPTTTPHKYIQQTTSASSATTLAPRPVIASKNESILQQSKVIEQTMDEIRISDPVKNLEQSLMLIQNRMMLASTYFSIDQLDESSIQLHKAAEQSLNLLPLLSTQIDQQVAFPQVLASLKNESQLNQIREFWKKSLSRFRKGSLELIQTLSQICSIYKQTGHTLQAQEISSKLEQIVKNNSQKTFLAVNFDPEHPLNLLSKKLTGLPFDTVFPVH